MGGKYRVAGGGQFVGVATLLEAGFRVNGSTAVRGWGGYGTGTTNAFVNTSTERRSGGGRLVTFEVFHSSGAARKLGNASDRDTQGWFSMSLDSGKVGASIGARATRSTDQTGVLHSTDTAVIYNGTEGFDTDGFHSTTVNPERMTIPAGLGGKYLLIANVVWDTTATNIRQVWFRPNRVRRVRSWLHARQRDERLPGSDRDDRPRPRGWRLRRGHRASGLGRHSNARGRSSRCRSPSCGSTPGGTGGGGSGGGSGALTFITETVLGADAADITIAGNTATYKDLIVVVKAHSTKATVDDVLLPGRHGRNHRHGGALLVLQHLRHLGHRDAEYGHDVRLLDGHTGCRPKRRRLRDR